MSTSYKTFQNLASKLGIDNEDQVMSKAAELERLLQTKSCSRFMNDTCKVILCLDLAASLFGIDFDINTAVKLSGLRKTIYKNYKQTLETLLNLNSDNKITLSKLCVTLHCETVQELAEDILSQYRLHSKRELDLNLTHYACLAVYHACRLSKIKVAKSKILEKSNLKPAQWSKINEEWTKFVDDKFANVSGGKGKLTKETPTNDAVQLMEVDCDVVTKVQHEVEPYSEWKRRTLEQAYRELREMEAAESGTGTANENEKMELENDVDVHLDILKLKLVTPRRSPRKTPQKHSPYKCPTKTNGVRLLFPAS